MLKTSIFDSFFAGHCLDAHNVFGAHFAYEGISGVRFTVFAPNARNIQVIGTFNHWNGSDAFMKKISPQGVWSIFIANVNEWDLYKYLIENAHGHWVEKSDPFAFYTEMRPKSSSLVVNLRNFGWTDKMWMNKRTKHLKEPMSIYEVHLGSWRKKYAVEWLNYEELARDLIPYVKEQGYTHIELMPLNEHPFDGSWGYQATGYFSATSRYGTPKQLMEFINQCHHQDIGVIIDFVPVHFVKDYFGLIEFDGTPLFEYPNPEDALSQWGTMVFDLWKEEVRSFLMSAASFWMDVYHIDGIRIDAVSNIIYWHGEKKRGVNEGALAFVRRLNYYLSQRYPSAILIAEDSSDYPKVTQPTFEMGLGFDYKWDLGWMNDTLKYYTMDPVFRSYHHHQLTFSMAYFYSEKFILPLSHDEVVHGKGTIINKMWGDYDQKFAQVKNLYLYMFSHPGKKLNFMGNELAHFREWDENREMDWHLLQYSRHNSLNRFMVDLNRVYTHHSCLSRYDYEQRGFRWIDADNSAQSIYSYYREDEKCVIVTVLNMTPVAIEELHVGVPLAGEYVELINSQKAIYEGNDMCNYVPLIAVEEVCHNQPYKIIVRVAPFGAMMLEVTKV
ncbi:MAG: 1,4-alpha-glucan branching protein GlgB [Erysipelotrichaceae bacterium]|nr:1,4-alpha-glucan branching protein GlgB [Erysipelotrichaceae bacterium]